MLLNIERKSNIAVVRILDDINITNENDFNVSLKELIEEGMNNIVINLENVEFFSCRGIRVLVENLKRARQLKGDMKIVNISKALKKIFFISGLNLSVEFFENEQEALSSFSNEAVSNIEKNLLWNINRS